MKIARHQLDRRQRRIQERIEHKAEDRDEPMLKAGNIQFEIAERPAAICDGVIGLTASLAWMLKAWSAQWLPETGRWQLRRRAEKRKVLRMLGFPPFQVLCLLFGRSLPDQLPCR